MDRPWAMYGTCWGMAGVYVGSLHALPQLVSLVRTGKSAPLRPRDHPSTMRERLICASFATLVDMAWTAHVLSRQGLLRARQPFRSLDALAWLGLPLPEPSFLVAHGLPLQPSLTTSIVQGLCIVGGATLLTSLLYLGTFFTDLQAHALPGQVHYYDETGPRPRLLVWRNYVVGPCTEELVFRSCIVATMKAFCPNMSRTTILLLAPLFFGAAHLHHVIESVRHQPRAWKAAVIRTGT